MKISHITLSGIFAIFAASGAFAIAQGGDLSLLESVERGMWQLRAVGGGPTTAPLNQICVSNPTRLVQIQHGAAPCEHYVVRSSATAVTVSYSCKGMGQGLTTIRKESPRLIQIQSQGIYNNAPFSFAVEGRRMSAC